MSISRAGLSPFLLPIDTFGEAERVLYPDRDNVVYLADSVSPNSSLRSAKLWDEDNFWTGFDFGFGFVFVCSLFSLFWPASILSTFSKNSIFVGTS